MDFFNVKLKCRLLIIQVQIAQPAPMHHTMIHPSILIYLKYRLPDFPFTPHDDSPVPRNHPCTDCPTSLTYRRMIHPS